MRIESRLMRLEKSIPDPQRRDCHVWYPAALAMLFKVLCDGEWHPVQKDLYPRQQSLLT